MTMLYPLVTGSSGLSGTNFIGDTRKSENIKIEKAMKYPKLKNSLTSDVNESELSTNSHVSYQISAIHLKSKTLAWKFK